MIKIDSSSLIYLIKLDLVDLTKKLYSEIALTPKIEEEVVVKGKKNNHTDAFVAESLLVRGKLSLHQPQTALPIVSKIHPAEIEILYTAKEQNCIVLIDDLPAQRYAISLGLSFRTVPFLLVELFEQKIITSQEFDKYFEQIISIMNLPPKDILYLQKCKEVLQ